MEEPPSLIPVAPSAPSPQQRVANKRERTPEEQAEINERMRRLRERKAEKRKERDDQIGLRIKHQQNYESSSMDESLPVADAHHSELSDPSPGEIPPGGFPGDSSLQHPGLPMEHSYPQETYSDIKRESLDARRARALRPATNQQFNVSDDYLRHINRTTNSISKPIHMPKGSTVHSSKSIATASWSVLDYVEITAKLAVTAFALWLMYQWYSREEEESFVDEAQPMSAAAAAAATSTLPVASVAGAGGRGGVLPIRPNAVERVTFLKSNSEWPE